MAKRGTSRFSQRRFLLAILIGAALAYSPTSDIIKTCRYGLLFTTGNKTCIRILGTAITLDDFLTATIAIYFVYCCVAASYLQQKPEPKTNIYLACHFYRCTEMDLC